MPSSEPYQRGFPTVDDASSVIEMLSKHCTVGTVKNAYQWQMKYEMNRFRNQWFEYQQRKSKYLQDFLVSSKQTEINLFDQHYGVFEWIHQQQIEAMLREQNTLRDQLDSMKQKLSTAQQEIITLNQLQQPIESDDSDYSEAEDEDDEDDDDDDDDLLANNHQNANRNSNASHQISLSFDSMPTFNVSPPSSINNNNDNTNSHQGDEQDELGIVGNSITMSEIKKERKKKHKKSKKKKKKKKKHHKKRGKFEYEYLSNEDDKYFVAPPRDKDVDETWIYCRHKNACDPNQVCGFHYKKTLKDHPESIQHECAAVVSKKSGDRVITRRMNLLIGKSDSHCKFCDASVPCIRYATRDEVIGIQRGMIECNFCDNGRSGYKKRGAKQTKPQSASPAKKRVRKKKKKKNDSKKKKPKAQSLDLEGKEADSEEEANEQLEKSLNRLFESEDEDDIDIESDSDTQRVRNPHKPLKRRKRKRAEMENDGNSSDSSNELEKSTKRQKTERSQLEQLSIDELLTQAMSLDTNVDLNWDKHCCRYCGARGAASFEDGPWGKHTLCQTHHTLWKQGQLDLSDCVEQVQPSENGQNATSTNTNTYASCINFDEIDRQIMYLDGPFGANKENTPIFPEYQPTELNSNHNHNNYAHRNATNPRIETSSSPNVNSTLNPAANTEKSYLIEFLLQHSKNHNIQITADGLRRRSRRIRQKEDIQNDSDATDSDDDDDDDDEEEDDEDESHQNQDISTSVSNLATEHQAKQATINASIRHDMNKNSNMHAIGRIGGEYGDRGNAEKSKKSKAPRRFFDATTVEDVSSEATSMDEIDREMNGSNVYANGHGMPQHATEQIHGSNQESATTSFKMS